MSTPPPPYPSFSLLRPWRELVDPTSLSFPISLSESTYRIKQNLQRYRHNYALITLFILFLSLLYHPISLLLFLLIFSAWLFFYFTRTDPVILLGKWVVDDAVVLGVLCVITFGGLVFTGVWLNIVLSILVGGFLVCGHGMVRMPEDVDDMESPYGPLLSVVDGPA